MGFINPSPSQPFIASLFGLGVKPHRGGFKLDPRRDPAIGGATLFDEQAFGDISSYIRGSSSSPFTAALGNIGQTGDFGALPPELLAPYQQATGTLDELIGRSRPVVSSLIETGNPVDVTNLVNTRMQNSILPQVSERFNPAEGSGFQNIAMREASNLIAELDYPAQEAARARQMEALTVASPTLAGLATERMGLPAAALGEASSISQLTDPGARLLAALMGILGYSQQGATLRESGGQGGGSGTGEILGALGSLVGAAS
jgi:hypothetical protein